MYNPERDKEIVDLINRILLLPTPAARISFSLRLKSGLVEWLVIPTESLRCLIAKLEVDEKQARKEICLLPKRLHKQAKECLLENSDNLKILQAFLNCRGHILKALEQVDIPTNNFPD